MYVYMYQFIRFSKLNTLLFQYPEDIREKFSKQESKIYVGQHEKSPPTQILVRKKVNNRLENENQNMED